MAPSVIFPVIESKIGHGLHQRLYELCIRHFFNRGFYIIIYICYLHRSIQLVFLLPLLFGYKLVFDPRVVGLGIVVHLFLVDELHHLLALAIRRHLAFF